MTQQDQNTNQTPGADTSAGMSADTGLVRTVLRVEILGTTAFSGDIEDLATACIDGDFSGTVLDSTAEPVNADTMAALLLAQGSDPSFLGLVHLGSERFATMPDTLADAVECEHGHLTWRQDPCEECSPY